MQVEMWYLHLTHHPVQLSSALPPALQSLLFVPAESLLFVLAVLVSFLFLSWSLLLPRVLREIVTV